jgi:hypothetical protein
LNYGKKDLQCLLSILQTDKIKINQHDQHFDFHSSEIALKCNLWSYYDLSFNKQDPKSISNTSLLPSPLVEYGARLSLSWLSAFLKKFFSENSKASSAFRIIPTPKETTKSVSVRFIFFILNFVKIFLDLRRNDVGRENRMGENQAAARFVECGEG